MCGLASTRGKTLGFTFSYWPLGIFNSPSEGIRIPIRLLVLVLYLQYTRSSNQIVGREVVVQCKLQVRRYFYSHKDYFKGDPPIPLCTKYKQNPSSTVLHGAGKKNKKTALWYLSIGRILQEGLVPSKKWPETGAYILHGGLDTHRYFTILE